MVFGLNLFLLIISCFELLLLQVGYMRGKVQWESMWVIFVECFAYGAGLVSPDAEFVELHLANGQYIEWLRYMGWILTCPVLLMTLVSMTTSDGTKPPTVRLVPLLVANLTMVCMGITAASCSEPTKWYIFAIAISFGGFVFSCAIQCFLALIFEAPESNVKCTSIMLTVTFLAGWGCFPVAFVIGHSGLGAVSKNVQWALFVIGDLLSKNAWVGFAALRAHQLDAIAERTATAASAAGLEAGGKGDSKAGGRKEGPSEENRMVKRRCSNSNLILSEINHPNAPTATELSSFKRTGVARTSPYDGAYPVGYGPGAMVHPSQVNPYLYGHGAYHHPHHPPHPHHAYGGAFPAAMAALARPAPSTGGGAALCKQEWARHQVEHALDYASGSRLWLHLSVGLNLQVEHHLFPQVGWGHYRELAPIVRTTCAEFGVAYSEQPSFWAALKGHFSHLQRLNSGELADKWSPQAYAQSKTR